MEKLPSLLTVNFCYQLLESPKDSQHSSIKLFLSYTGSMLSCYPFVEGQSFLFADKWFINLNYLSFEQK